MKRVIAFALLCMVVPQASEAWLRGSYTDEEVVSRAQVIVVARIKEGSLKEFSRDATSIKEYRATLLVSEVLKGPFRLAEVPIEIAYGLTPRIGGESEPDGIRIYDTGNSIVSFQPITEDLGEDQIWFLRVNHDGSGDAKRSLRIYDPEDIQSVKKLGRIQDLITKTRPNKSE